MFTHHGGTRFPALKWDMRVNLGLRSEELAGVNLVYSKDPAGSAHFSAPTLRSGRSAFQTASRRPASASLQPLAGDPLSPRDGLYAKTDLAVALLDSNLSVFGFVEQVIQKLPAEGETAFSRTALDDNFCRLKALMADLQRPAVSLQNGSYEQYKQTVAKTIDLLAEDCRRHVTEAVGTATSLSAGLSPAEMETVQGFNHLRRAMQSVFNLPVEDGEIYLEAQVKTDNSLDDRDRGGMNRIFSTISYSGTNRPFYMRYMPYYLMTMRAPLFLHALSRPRQLSATTTRPGPRNLPERLAARYGVPRGTPVTYHSVSRYGLSNQTSEDSYGLPMKFYYSYQEGGVTKALSLDRKEHFYVQLMNRPSLTIPEGVVPGLPLTEAKYVMYQRQQQAYLYDAGPRRLALNQQQHQKILRYNADLGRIGESNSAVNFSFASDGSLESVMNRIFNDNAVRKVSNRSSLVQLIPQGYKDKMQLMTELTAVIRPAFQREQERIEALRAKLFEEFAAGKINKDVVEDTCRKEAVASFRKLIAERRMQVPPQAGRQLIGQAIATISDLFEEMYSNKAADFARLAAGRQLFAAKVEPFHTAFKENMAGNNGYLNLSRVLEDLGAENRKAFDAAVLRVTEKMEEPAGFKSQLKAAYWGGVTQYLVDLHYGPEGLVSEGSYIKREGLPANGREFERYLEQKAPELLSDPVQVANRLRATFAYFDYNVSPYYSLPWPNLYRNNDLLRSSGRPNEVRDPKTLKPNEASVNLSIVVDGQAIRMAGTVRREASRPKPAACPQQRVAPSNTLAPSLA
jgi:hypothetical protein